MAELFNSQRVAGVVLVDDGAEIYNNLPVIGIRDQTGDIFDANQRVLGVAVLGEDPPSIYNDQPVVGAVLIEDGRKLYNWQLVIPVEVVSGEIE